MEDQLAHRAQVRSEPDDQTDVRVDNLAAPTAAICDDDPVMRSLGSSLLEREGFQIVAEVDSAYAAVQVARVARPTVLVLDLVLPDFTGEAALPEIRAAAPTTEILVWSGYPSSFDFAALGATLTMKGGNDLSAHLRAIRASWLATRSIVNDARTAHQARQRATFAPRCDRRLA